MDLQHTQKSCQTLLLRPFDAFVDVVVDDLVCCANSRLVDDGGEGVISNAQPSRFLAHAEPKFNEWLLPCNVLER